MVHGCAGVLVCGCWCERMCFARRLETPGVCGFLRLACATSVCSASDCGAVLAAVQRGGSALKTAAAAALKVERGIVLAAVQQNGRALQLAVPPLRVDHGIVRAAAQQSKLYVGMVLNLIFAEALGLYGLIVGLILSSKGGSAVCGE